jgi:hypothetical protein
VPRPVPGSTEGFHAPQANGREKDEQVSVPIELLLRNELVLGLCEGTIFLHYFLQLHSNPFRREPCQV